MRLRQLAAALGISGEQLPDIEIADIAYDSRQVTPGTLFIAIPSVSGDASRHGNRFIEQAVERGAVAVVAEGFDGGAGVPVIPVSDARAALGDLAAEFFGNPSEQLHLYAVTGTDGKTTTTYLLEQILAASGATTGLIGTVEIKIGEERLFNLDRMTTPESLDVQRLLRRMVDAGVTHVAMEASSHALALDRLRGCSIAGAGLTNITADHIEFHGTWEAYFEAKASLFTRVAAGKPAVLNADDPSFSRLSRMITGPVTAYSVDADADLSARDLRLGETGTTCIMRFRGQEAEVTVPLPGRFNVANALAATGLALAEGLSLQEIAAALGSAAPPPGRMQRIEAGQPFSVLIDYAHTVNAFRSVLSGVRALTPPPRKVIAVFGAAGNRDRAKRPELARIAEQQADFFVITNEDPFGERAEDIIAEITAGADPSQRGRTYEIEPDRRAAITRALEQARPGDAVVILGKGHEKSMVVDGRKEPWSDADTVRAILGAAP